MTVAEEKVAFDTLISKLPAGYVKIMPFSVSTGLAFEYGGVSVEISALYLNRAMNCYMFDMSWSSVDKIYGIPVRGGIDLLRQFATPLPNLYAVNHAYAGQDVLNVGQLQFLIIDASALEPQ